MIKKTYFFLNIFLFATTYILAQEKDLLNKEKEQIIQEITYIKDQINQAELDKKSNLTTLLLYERDIELRDSLIKEYERDVLKIELSLDSLQFSLNGLYKKEINIDLEITNVEIKIFNLSTLLSQTITQIYLANKHENLLNILTQNSSFDQIINQYIYLQTITKTAKTVLQKLRLETQKLDTLQTDLENNKAYIQQSIYESNKLIKGKKLFVNKKENQRDSLKNQSVLKENLVQSLNSKIKLLNQEVIDKEKIAQQIENEIIKLNKENDSTENTVDFNLSTLNFENEKGNLDWPADNCVVLSGFGTVRHREYPDQQYVNRGITLAIPRSNSIKSIFSGYVSNVIVLPNSLKAIIIQHGIYFTVYNKLDETYVQIGDFVTKNEPIGSLYVEENHKTGLMEFQVWKEIEPVNPKIWLKKH